MDWFLNLWAQLPSLETIKTWVEITFYLTTGLAAWRGLSLWRAQMRSTAEYELAKRVLTGTYRIRDAILTTCSPFMTGAEHADRPRDPNESAQKARALDAYYAYQKRLEHAYKEQANLYPHLIEAEALLGTQAREAVELIYRSLGTLRATIETYFQAMAQNAVNLDSQNYRQWHNIIYGISSTTNPSLKPEQNDDDGFRRNLDQAVERIREVFAPHIVSFHPKVTSLRESKIAE